MTTTPTSGAAIQRYKIGYHADEWGQRSSTPSGIPDASGSWVRYADHVNALAAGQAAAASADSVLNDACHAPPLGWRCTRKAGHEDDKLFVDRGMQRIRDAEDAAQKEGE